MSKTKKWSNPKGWVKRTSKYDNPTWKRPTDKYGKNFIGVAKLGNSWTFTGLSGKTENYGSGKKGRKTAMLRARQYMKDRDK